MGEELSQAITTCRRVLKAVVELIGEQKADGFRAVIFARPDQVLIQSRQGGDLTPAFLDIASAAAGLGGKGLASRWATARIGTPGPTRGIQAHRVRLGNGLPFLASGGVMAGAHPRRLRYLRSELFTRRYKIG